jgi:hypothetical protein
LLLFSFSFFWEKDVQLMISFSDFSLFGNFFLCRPLNNEHYKILPFFNHTCCLSANPPRRCAMTCVWWLVSFSTRKRKYLIQLIIYVSLIQLNIYILGLIFVKFAYKTNSGQPKKKTNSWQNLNLVNISSYLSLMH